MRIRLHVEQTYLHRFHAMLDVRDLLQDAGIHLLAQDDPGPHDVLFLQESIFRKSPSESLGEHEPAIIYERIGCAPVNVGRSVRRLLRRPNVLAWTKETDFRDHSLNNEPMIAGRYHLATINVLPETQHAQRSEVLLEAADFAKIHRIFPIYMQERYDYLKTLRTRSLGKRPIEVFFAGTMHYENPLVDCHRMRCVEAMSKLDRQCLIATGNVFDRNHFQDLLVTARVFVSPYGSGVYSWKDFEAILAGCVLVKPKADYVTTYGFDIYDPGRYCVQCAPDFSDLNEIVNSVLDDLGTYRDFAIAAQSAILAACDRERYAADLVTFFRGIEEKAATAATPAASL